MIKRGKTNRVIFHHALADHASAADIDAWHRERGFGCIGYHYVVRIDGRVEEGRTEEAIGAHAHGANHDSIGVCLEGDFRRYGPSGEQINTVRALYLSLCERYGKSLRVEFHRSIDNPCPGPKLDRDAFRDIIGA